MGRWHGRTVALILALTCSGLAAACSGGGSAPGALPPSTSSASAAGSAAGPGTAASGASEATGAAGAATSGSTGAGTSGGAGATPSDGTTPSRTLASSSTRRTPPPQAGTTVLPVVPAGTLRGKVVVIDPGHNGANFRHTAEINRIVAIGNGTKACDTTGTETNGGYAEAAFTFDVSRRLAALLREAGATVVLTRADNDGVGPCITERAAVGNRAHADAAISVHGDGGPSSGYGFHVIVPRGIGSNDAIVSPSRRLGVDVRDAFHSGTGEQLSTYAGTRTAGLVARDDLGGLNLSAVPKVFIECGNMRNAADARRMTSAVWRQLAAAALADGITRFLVGRP